MERENHPIAETANSIGIITCDTTRKDLHADTHHPPKPHDGKDAKKKQRRQIRELRKPKLTSRTREENNEEKDPTHRTDKEREAAATATSDNRSQEKGITPAGNTRAARREAQLDLTRSSPSKTQGAAPGKEHRHARAHFRKGGNKNKHEGLTADRGKEKPTRRSRTRTLTRPGPPKIHRHDPFP